MLTIPVGCLRTTPAMPFDIYIQPGGRGAPVLYREKDLPMDAAVRERLWSHGVQNALIPASAEYTYGAHLEGHLPAILQDPEMSAPAKTAVVYRSACALMMEVMQSPRAGQLCGRTQELVNHAVGFFLTHDETLSCLADVLSFDYYTYTHSVNVFAFSICLAKAAGYKDPEVLREFGQGCLLHDAGKSRISPDIINAKTKLSEAQWAVMQRHPVHSFDILVEAGEGRDLALDAARSHHEKLDGSGYPDGLVASELSPFVRMITIADIFDALTTRRPYKDAMNRQAALRIMYSEMRRKLDMDLFQVFVDMLGEEPPRSELRLKG